MFIRMFAVLAITVAALCAFILWAHGRDDDRFKDATPEIRQWFKQQRSPSGVPCCDVSDGHRTEWKAAPDGTYRAFFENEWLPVPRDTVIPNARNPFFEAVVWIAFRDGKPVVRCFVPGAGT